LKKLKPTRTGTGKDICLKKSGMPMVYGMPTYRQAKIHAANLKNMAYRKPE
jgi:hypothetical protein